MPTTKEFPDGSFSTGKMNHLFPFNRGRRLGGDVVDDAVDVADFVDDPAGNDFHSPTHQPSQFFSPDRRL